MPKMKTNSGAKKRFKLKNIIEAINPIYKNIGFILRSNTL